MFRCSFKHCLFIVLFVFASLPSALAQQVYVAGLNRNFGLLNPQTGTYNFIGQTSILMGGLGFTADGNLYGLGHDSNLYRINTVTAATTLIGNTGIVLTGWGMGATTDGTLYAYGEGHKVYRVNPADASTTYLGDCSFESNGNINGDANNNLYMTPGTHGNGFYKIDRLTGQGILLGNASYGNVGALVSINNMMYAFNQAGGIYTVDLTNGQSTLIANYNTTVVGPIYGATIRFNNTGGSGGYLEGTVTLLDCTDPEQNITFEFRSKTGGGSFKRKQVLTPSGPNRGIFSLPNIPPGTYDIAVKGYCWLQQVIPNVLVAGNVSGLEATLWNGDLSGDNVVDIADFGILVANYGSAGDP